MAFSYMHNTKNSRFSHITVSLRSIAHFRPTPHQPIISPSSAHLASASDRKSYISSTSSAGNRCVAIEPLS